MFKKAIFIALLAVTAVGGTVATVGAQGNTEATVELRVWQRVSDPLRIDLSVRPAEGRWGRTERLPMVETSASKNFRYTDRSVAVPVAGGTANVELRVWQRISDPGRVYLSARPAGGAWGRAERLPMAETSASKAFRYTDRSVAVALPAPEVTIVFWGDFSESQQVAIRARTANVVEFFEARYGVHVPELQVHVGADDAALDEATRSAAGARTWLGFEQYRDGLLFMRMDASADAIGHLYFYAIQDYLSQGRDRGPGWLSDGAAAYAAHVYQHARGERSLDEAMAYNRWASSHISAPLEEFDAERPAVPRTDVSGSLAALAVGWLVEQGGGDSLVDYYRLLPGSETWTEAFEAAFGVPFSEVYSAFAAYRAETVAVRRDVSGVVLGPDGEPVEDWRIDIEAFPAGPQHISSLREHATNEGFSGNFTSRLPDGTYVLALVTRCPGGWVDLGWYGGESGFTRSDDDATRVVVDGENIEGLAIQLPALPDEMFPERCSHGPRVEVSGVVIGLDGEPRPDIYLTSYDPIAEVWPDNTVSAADGSFTLSLPEEAAYRIGAAAVCERRGRPRPIGGWEHAIEGDVHLDADGLLLVASEDIDGVIIQLRDTFACPS